MWLWSRNNECGSVSAVRAMLASPLRASSTARICGFLARVVGPVIRVCSFGLKPSLLHSIAWNGELTANELQDDALAGFDPPPLMEPVVACAAQLVGLSMKLLRSTLTSIERMSSFTPPNTFGMASDTAFT